MPKKVNQETVIDRFISVHGYKYDYSKVVYSRMHDNVCIVCPEHGEFWMSPHSHIAGQGCPKCGIERRSVSRKDDKDSFIVKSRAVHGDRYDYSKVEYKGSQVKVCIICPEHGEFWQRPNGHLLGQGCPMCKAARSSERMSDSCEGFIGKLKKVYGDEYDYSGVEYAGTNVPVRLICRKHGEFTKRPNSLLQGHGCPTCGYEKSHRARYTTESWVENAIKVHGDRYDYSKVRYVSPFEPVSIVCPIHGEFKQKPSYHLSGNGCPKCGVTITRWEEEVYEFVKGMCGDAIRCDRQTLGNMEIDILVPGKSVGFECDGLYWHCEKKKDRNYHIRKTKACEEKGVRLVHIFEDEWIYRKECAKDRIRSILGCTEERLYARNCEVREVDSGEAMKFIEENHIQGKVASRYRFGLYHCDELVAIMTFGCMRKNLGSRASDGCFELLRFCCKSGVSVVGGASKLLRRFIREVRPVEIVSYCDLRWSDGNLYERLGFELDHTSTPNYFYVIGDKRKNRFNFRKDVLVKEGYDKDKSEHQIMLGRKIYRIYDCGTKVYKMRFSDE